MIPATSLDTTLANLEKQLFSSFAERIQGEEYCRIGVSSVISTDTHNKQEMVALDKAIQITPDLVLAGSAEQGILEQIKGKALYANSSKGLCLFATNQCYRVEKEYIPNIRCLEFKKLEMFHAFSPSSNWKQHFNTKLKLIIGFLNIWGIEHRLIDKTHESGYHHKKTDVEVLTDLGWLETHSCLYYADEHSKRFGFTELTHTIACTGIASPRILIPFIEGRTVLGDL